jgi:hypothetical protein
MINKSLHNQIQFEQIEHNKKKRIAVKQHEYQLKWKWCWTPVCVNKYT